MENKYSEGECEERFILSRITLVDSLGEKTFDVRPWMNEHLMKATAFGKGDPADYINQRIVKDRNMWDEIAALKSGKRLVPNFADVAGTDAQIRNVIYVGKTEEMISFLGYSAMGRKDIISGNEIRREYNLF